YIPEAFKRRRRPIQIKVIQPGRAGSHKDVFVVEHDDRGDAGDPFIERRLQYALIRVDLQGEQSVCGAHQQMVNLYRGNRPKLLRGNLNIDGDRKSTRLNSSHVKISYAVLGLKKKIN